MSMSTYVQAFRDFDGNFQKMMDIKNFCESQGVSLPREVEEYFGKYSLDDEPYIREQMSEVELPKGCKTEGDDSRVNGRYIEIDVTKLPKDIKKIRFTNSW